MTAVAESSAAAILIHGLWMHGLVFLPLQRRLEKLGFAVRRFSYPAWRWSLERNAELLAVFVADTRADTIHLVAHSLGGLVALTMLTRGADARIRRLVLMGSPCAGCHSGDYMAANPALSPLLGRSIKDWRARPRPIPPATVDIGVIAGTRRFGLGSLVIPGLPLPNDGVVAVAETSLPEARDSIALAVSHSGMLVSRTCAEQAAAFLRSGRFIHA